jgi:hypothetical protein
MADQEYVVKQYGRLLHMEGPIGNVCYNPSERVFLVYI